MSYGAPAFDGDHISQQLANFDAIAAGLQAKPNSQAERASGARR